MVRLILLRHAKSDWGTAADDIDRPLAQRGRDDAPRMGAWLAAQGWTPAAVVASPATRARDTALLACQAMGCPEDVIRLDAALYGAGPERIEAVAAAAAADDRDATIMVVGHNPGIEGAVERLAAAPVVMPPDGKLMATATAALLEGPRVGAGAMTLVGVRRPRDRA